MADLSRGVIVVLSGGPFDEMNPPEVRGRMNEFITAVNDDPYVKANSGGKGLTFHLIKNQKEKYLHQTAWRKVCKALESLTATPLIIVGHSNGGAAALNVTRCIRAQSKTVDLLFTADSVGTLDDIGDPHEVNLVPDTVRLNINSWVIPTPASLLLPFPLGRPNRRETGSAFANLLNIGLRYNLPGAIAHRNAFYHLAGGDKTLGGGYEFPSVLLETTLAVLRGDAPNSIIDGVVTPLQGLASGENVQIELETQAFKKTLKP